MARETGIAWTDHTWSPWLGCTKVSPGCDHCYAEALDARHKWGGATHWGAGVPRRRTSASYWKQAESWNRAAEKNGTRPKVFPSLCDPFDNEVPDAWRLDFARLIADTPNLTWLLLTKRIGNVAKMQGADSLLFDVMQRNVRLGASVVNQKEADRDITTLLATPAASWFVSYEPALGPVHWQHEWLHRSQPILDHCAYAIPENPRIDWIIVGGESSQGGQKARPFNIEWARSTIVQCKAAGVACFVKQLGSKPMEWVDAGDEAIVNVTTTSKLLSQKDRAGADPAEWPPDLRVQEFPR